MSLLAANLLNIKQLWEAISSGIVVIICYIYKSVKGTGSNVMKILTLQLEFLGYTFYKLFYYAN